jgi:LmbE family N-acetylglucosaminyl deacetylase
MVRLDFHREATTPFRILCLGAHSDDIEIGCGGTLLKLTQAWHGNLRVDWIVFSATDEREREAARSAARFLKGVKSKSVVIERFETSYLPYSGSQVKKYMQQLSRRVKPDLVFTHYRHDLHQDHRLISELTWNAFRDHLILEYEIPKYDGDLGAPNVFVPLTHAQCQQKIRLLLDCFTSQREKNWFDAETFSGLMRLRGVESQTRYAEAFYARKLVLD